MPDRPRLRGRRGAGRRAGAQHPPGRRGARRGPRPGPEIATNAAPVSAALTRQMLWRMLGADHPMEAHKIDSRGIYSTGRAADAREGVTAFLEKRPASWTMTPSRDMPDWYPWWEDEPSLVRQWRARPSTDSARRACHGAGMDEGPSAVAGTPGSGPGPAAAPGHRRTRCRRGSPRHPAGVRGHGRRCWPRAAGC